MPFLYKRPKIWFVAGVIALAVAGAAAGARFFSSNRNASSPSLQFSLKPAAAQSTASSAAAGAAQPDDAEAAGEKQKNKTPAKAPAAEGLRLLEQARALELGLDGGPVDLQKAFALYQKAAALGSAEAWYRMGVLARDGKVDRVDAKSALKFFNEAADAGYTDAYAALARAYLEGRLAKTDIAKANYYLDLALEAGSAEAMFLKGSLLAGTEGSEQAGLALLMEAAKEGDADAQYTIGRMYRDGMVVAQDLAMAEQWLRFAIENGSEKAKAELGVLKAGAPVWPLL